MGKPVNNKNILTKQGCKNTRSREAIIGVLEKAKAPVSADEIYLEIKKDGRNTNLSTIYRNLELLESKCLVSKSLMSEGKARYELTGDGHKHHLICTNCHKMIAIDTCPFEEMEKELCAKTKFEITGHNLELYGICPECKK